MPADHSLRLLASGAVEAREPSGWRWRFRTFDAYLAWLSRAAVLTLLAFGACTQPALAQSVPAQSAPTVLITPEAASESAACWTEASARATALTRWQAEADSLRPLLREAERLTREREAAADAESLAREAALAACDRRAQIGEDQLAQSERAARSLKRRLWAERLASGAIIGGLVYLVLSK